MKQNNQDFALGLTLIVLLGLFLGSFFFLYNSPIWKPPTREIVVYFTLDEGLAPLEAGNRVLLYGALEVGEVKSVVYGVRGDEGTESAPVVIVTAEVKKDVPLYKDCRISTTAPMIGGGGALVIVSPGEVEAGDISGPIRGERAQSLQAAIEGLSDWLLKPGGFLAKLDTAIDPDAEGSIMNKVNRSLDDINQMTAELQRQLTPEEQRSLMAKFHRLLDNINGVTAAIRAETDAEVQASMLAKLHVMLDRVDASLVDVRTMISDAQPVVQQTLSNVESASRTLDAEILGAFAKEFDRENPDSLLAKIHESMTSAQASLDDIQQIAGTGKRMIVVNRPAVDRTLDNIREASERLKTGIIEISLQPWRIMTPPTQDERDRISFFEAARLFAVSARQLDDASARLEALSEGTSPEGRTLEDIEELESLRASLKAAFERFQEAEQFLYQKVK